MNSELYYGQGFPFFKNNDLEVKKGAQKNLDVRDPESLIQMLFIQRSMVENHRHSGQIAFPGGHCEPGESDKDAAAREAFEEV